jgi:hypothetical protein
MIQVWQGPAITNYMDILMNLTLSKDELQTILQSLKYSKLSVSEAPNTPKVVREANLRSLEAVEQKIILAIKGI